MAYRVQIPRVLCAYQEPPVCLRCISCGCKLGTRHLSTQFSRMIRTDLFHEISQAKVISVGMSGTQRTVQQNSSSKNDTVLPHMPRARSFTLLLLTEEMCHDVVTSDQCTEKQLHRAVDYFVPLCHDRALYFEPRVRSNSGNDVLVNCMGHIVMSSACGAQLLSIAQQQHAPDCLGMQLRISDYLCCLGNESFRC
jgi:hypothetical protein